MKFAVLALLGAVSAVKRTVLSTTDAPSAIGPYSQGIMIEYTSGEGVIDAAGQVGIIPSTGELAAGGITPETKQLMENIKAILKAGGAKMSDVTECSCLLADLNDYAAFNKVYEQYFDAASAPARAAFQVVKLPKGARAEVKCSAIKNPTADESDSEDEEELDENLVYLISQDQFRHMNKDVHSSVIKTKTKKEIGKKNAKLCKKLEEQAYSNPLFTEKSKKGKAFRTKVQSKIDELKCYHHMH